MFSKFSNIRDKLTLDDATPRPSAINPLPPNISPAVVSSDLQGVRDIVKKLPIADQVLLYKQHERLPEACIALWSSSQKKLDFRVVDKGLSGEALSHFLDNMQDNFRYVCFQSERLQANLNLLECAGVKCLKGVHQCELLMEGEISDEGAGDAASLMSQWPLHTLPKLMRNLRRLKVHCDVQVHFIEHFPQLEILILEGNVVQSALTGILERCGRLKRLFLKSHANGLNLSSIRKCPSLQDLSVPIPLFGFESEHIMSVTGLQFLQLTHCEMNGEWTLNCLCHVLNTRAEVVEVLQVDCKCFEGPQWMREVGLERCQYLRGLVLISCQFHELEASEMALPMVHGYLAFFGCHDLKEHQLLDMVKRCPGLCELYLIDCPQLSGKVLQSIYGLRRAENLDTPLTIIVSRCQSLQDDYEKLYTSHWYFKTEILKLELLKDDNSSLEHIQMFFYKNL